MAFQGVFKEVLFQGSFKKVSRVFQGRWKDVSSEFSVGFKGVSRNFQGCSKKIFRVMKCQGCCKEVLRVLHGSIKCVSRKF